MPAMAEGYSGHHPYTGDAQQTLRLTTTLLNGTNYPSWARSIHFSLFGKDKLSHITGKTVKPTEQKISIKPTSTEEEVPKTTGTSETEFSQDPEWAQNDINVMNWLLNSMKPQVAKLFMYFDSAKEIWDEVKEMYSQEQNFAYIFHLKQEISQTKQENRKTEL
jgi:gag-polypeptide of LTR copia-type